MQAVKEEEELLPPLPAEAPPRPPAPAPVSKWTLVDYDEDNPPADLDGCAASSHTCILNSACRSKYSVKARLCGMLRFLDRF